MTTIPGVDYAWAPHPSPRALAAAGKKFAARYSSNDHSKDLTRAEADALAAAGIWSVLVRESTAKRAAAGRAAGITDAHAALRTGAACGMPASRPLYFAVDYDAEPLAVVPYFQGVASVIGLPRTGVYGGFAVVKYLLDHGLAKWAWQTRAWSQGRWDPRAHIRQGATQTINAVSCDLNTAMTSDYGQWMPGKLPQEDDMPTAQEVAQATADLLITPRYRDALASASLYWLVRALDPDAVLPTGPDAPGAAVQAAALRTALAKHTAGSGITDTQLDTLAGRVVTALVAQAAKA